MHVSYLGITDVYETESKATDEVSMKLNLKHFIIAFSIKESHTLTAHLT